jgi:hypothetical protein
MALDSSWLWGFNEFLWREGKDKTSAVPPAYRFKDVQAAPEELPAIAEEARCAIQSFRTRGLNMASAKQGLLDALEPLLERLGAERIGEPSGTQMRLF